MDSKIMDLVTKDQLKNRPQVNVGDTVKLSMKIKENNRERVQVFEGVVISLQGSGINKTVTVRKISYGVGVERIVPLHAPTLEKIEVVKRGKVRRSKLYYMRGKIGKRAMDVSKSEKIYLTDEVVVPETGTDESVVADEVAVETISEDSTKDEVVATPEDTAKAEVVVDEAPVVEDTPAVADENPTTNSESSDSDE